MDFGFDLKKVLSFGAVVIMSLTAIAQKQTTSVQQMRVSYNNQTRLSNNLGLWGDFHLRTKEDFLKIFQQVYRYIHAARISYFQNLDLRKKTAEQNPKL
jgi:hypothetical protein